MHFVLTIYFNCSLRKYQLQPVLYWKSLQIVLTKWSCCEDDQVSNRIHKTLQHFMKVVSCTLKLHLFQVEALQIITKGWMLLMFFDQSNWYVFVRMYLFKHLALSISHCNLRNSNWTKLKTHKLPSSNYWFKETLIFHQCDTS